MLFPLTSESVDATSGSPVETQFAGTLVPQAPEAPEGLAVLATGSATLDLSWTDKSDDETRTEIERKQGPHGRWSTVGSLEPDVTAFQDVGLIPATTYSYRVRACNDVGCSEFSNEASATTYDIPPASPTSLVATKTGPFGIDLSWSDGSLNETRFEVERRVGTGGDWAQLVAQGPDLTTAQRFRPPTQHELRLPGHGPATISVARPIRMKLKPRRMRFLPSPIPTRRLPDRIHDGMARVG